MTLDPYPNIVYQNNFRGFIVLTFNWGGLGEAPHAVASQPSSNSFCDKQSSFVGDPVVFSFVRIFLCKVSYALYISSMVI